MLRYFDLAKLFGFAAIGLAAASACGQHIASDNGDGTYTNPVIPADYPDCDVIRVGADYYMVSSDFHNVPADPILHSADLVNWQVIGHAIPVYDGDSRYNMQGGERYGLGSWAPSIRYHDGMFYVLYNTNDHGAFVSRASNPAGPWTVNALGVTLYDPGLFFDDDGRVWVVSGQGRLSLTELSSDLRSIKMPPSQIYSGQHYDEGSHVYRRNGYYYILTATSRPDLPARFALQVERARALSGPYETKVVFTDDGNWSGWALHQGGFVETAKGEWWAMLFQDRADFGREPTLQPVQWVDDWPVIGVQGRAVITYKKPDVGIDTRPSEMKRSDDFTRAELGLQWEWNHNPDSDRWSLSERPGFLRLKTASVTSSLRSARNTIGQRLVEGGPVTATAKLDVSAMHNGDVSGLSIFQVGDSSIAVLSEGQRKIVVRNGDRIVATAELPVEQASVWLRLQTSRTHAEVRYSYSIDGLHFLEIDKSLPMQLHMFDYWVGQRICLFNYATKALGGYVDVDSFEYRTPERTNLFSGRSKIEASRYDEIAKAHVQWTGDPFETEKNRDKRLRSYEMTAGAFEPGGWLKFNRVDFGAGVRRVSVNAATGSKQRIDLHLDSPEGRLLGSCTIEPHAVAEEFRMYECPVSPVRGAHALYLVAPNGGDESFRINWFRFDNCRASERAASPRRREGSCDLSRAVARPQAGSMKSGRGAD